MSIVPPSLYFLICEITIYLSLWRSYHKEEFMILSTPDAIQTPLRTRYVRCLMVLSTMENDHARLAGMRDKW